MAWSAPVEGFEGRPWVADWPAEGSGALKMLCWRSVTSTAAAAPVVILKVPSSLAITLDFDLAYVTFCVVVSSSP